MNSITQYAIDFIYAKITGGKVWFGNLARYKTRYEVTDFAEDDLVTRYFVESIVAPSPVFNGEIVNIFSGTTLTIGIDGRGYVDIDYSPFLVNHGNSPGIFILQRIVNNAPTEEVNEILYDVPWQSLSAANTLNTIRVFPHVNPSDPNKSIDDIIILIK